MAAFLSRSKEIVAEEDKAEEPEVLEHQEAKKEEAKENDPVDETASIEVAEEPEKKKKKKNKKGKKQEAEPEIINEEKEPLAVIPNPYAEDEDDEGFQAMEGGDKDVEVSGQRPAGFSEQRDALLVVQHYPSRDWFLEWRKSLNLQNIKACISHTYNKAMHIRNQMIEQDPSLSSL